MSASCWAIGCSGGGVTDDNGDAGDPCPNCDAPMIAGVNPPKSSGCDESAHIRASLA